jgi:hypothetical protein
LIIAAPPDLVTSGGQLACGFSARFRASSPIIITHQTPAAFESPQTPPKCKRTKGNTPQFDLIVFDYKFNYS